MVSLKKHIPFILGLLIVVLLSTYKLTESPPTWMDEGIFSQVARNMALHGEHGMQVAPGVFENGMYITTSYAVTAPIAASHLLFGTGILQSRSVMVLFIIGGYCAFYALMRRRLSGWPLLLSLLLVAFFAPLYGHGKNVMGEVPGITYFLLGSVFLARIFEGKRLLREYVLFGIFMGLAIITKPTFLPIVPAILLSLFVFRTEIFGNRKQLLVCAAALGLPIIVWILIQFGGTSLATILSYYSNPNSTFFLSSIPENIRRFFAELQPLYTGGLFMLWTLSGVWRIKKGSFKESISPVEFTAWTFSLLTLLSFLRTVGYYRYFLAAEFLALIFVVPSLLESVSVKYKKYIFAVCGVLVVFHAYQTFFSSWVSTYTEGTKSALLKENVGGISPLKKVFFYRVPEAVNFLPATFENYHQYVKINTVLENGASELVLLRMGEPDIVITNSQFLGDSVLSKYTLEKEFDRYAILVKKI